MKEEISLWSRITYIHHIKGDVLDTISESNLAYARETSSNI